MNEQEINETVPGFCEHGRSTLICGVCFEFPKHWSEVVKWEFFHK